MNGPHSAMLLAKDTGKGRKRRKLRVPQKAIQIHKQARKQLHCIQIIILMYTTWPTGCMHLKASCAGCLPHAQKTFGDTSRSATKIPSQVFMLYANNRGLLNFPHSTTSGGLSGDEHPLYTQGPNPRGGMGKGFQDLGQNAHGWLWDPAQARDTGFCRELLFINHLKAAAGSQ